MGYPDTFNVLDEGCEHTVAPGVCRRDACPGHRGAGNETQEERWPDFSLGASGRVGQTDMGQKAFHRMGTSCRKA